MMRRLGVALAFSTLCFINTWVELAQGRAAYFARHDPVQAVVLPVLCWQVVIALVVLFLPRVALVVLSVVPLGFTSLALLRLLPFAAGSIVLRPWFWLAALVVGAIGAWVAWKQRKRLPDVREVYLYSLPVLLLIVIQAGWQQFPSAQYRDRPNVAQPGKLVRQEGLRVVWIIFDEMSQEAAFERRPAGLLLPNLDRLRERGFTATNVLPPAPNTLESLPSLMTGKVVAKSVPKGPRELELYFADGTRANWSEVQTVLDRVPVRSGLAGWFHPYCRVLPAESTSECEWMAGALLTGIEEPHLLAGSMMSAMGERFWYQIRAFPLLGRVPGLSALTAANEEKQRRLQWLVNRSLRMAADPGLGLVLLHYPVPHPPGGYIANLKRADDILGALVHAVERAGLDGRTAYVVSSDHGWRPEIWSRTADWSAEEEKLARVIAKERIPFVVHLPEENAARYEGEWNSVGTAGLVLRLIGGKVANVGDLVAEFAGGS
ncbi:hypothetical protein F183_A21000 [Bryobacterales bacterium F-183]|nr:hypothetical protein F183_A21000 [Bryobacterales bacterium F-183]